MKQSDIARFWSWVERSEGCWTWTGLLNNMGYGYIDTSTDGRRRRYLAHRFAFQLDRGVTLTRGEKVLHSCDNPPCVNPDHLRAGTQLANIRDALAKGRMDMTGLTAAFTQACRECGAEFTGAPNRRYCDDHRYYPNRRRNERRKIEAQRKAAA